MIVVCGLDWCALINTAMWLLWLVYLMTCDDLASLHLWSFLVKLLWIIPWDCKSMRIKFVFISFMGYFFLRITNPAHEIITPIVKICIPYVIQFEFAYINDDSGPIIDCPCRWNMMPKALVIEPMNIRNFPDFMYSF